MSQQVFHGVRQVLIDDSHAGQRIDNFLLGLLKKVPRSRLYRLLRKGEVRVNKKRVTPAFRLQSGDLVRIPPVHEPEGQVPPVASRSRKQELADAILFEDAVLMVVNKPAGMPVHGGAGTAAGLIETMRLLHPEWPQLELVHRLDLDTSGCLVLAKKRSVLRELHALWRSMAVNKTYQVLTAGHWKKTECLVEVPLEKNHLCSGERMVRVSADGKAARTLFRPLIQYEGATLAEAILHTGRTHQIRVHACHRTHPVAGDTKYGDRNFNRLMREKGLQRMFLHAARLAFTLPSSGRKYVTEAPLPLELEAVLARLTPQ